MSRGSLRQIGVFSNPLLLWGIAFELAFAAAAHLPSAHAERLRDGGALSAHLAVLAPFSLIVWGSDELRRWALRRRNGRGRLGRPNQEPPTTPRE